MYRHHSLYIWVVGGCLAGGLIRALAAERGLMPLRGRGYRPTASGGWEIQLLHSFGHSYRAVTKGFRGRERVNGEDRRALPERHRRACVTGPDDFRSPAYCDSAAVNAHPYGDASSPFRRGRDTGGIVIIDGWSYSMTLHTHGNRVAPVHPHLIVQLLTYPTGTGQTVQQKASWKSAA